MRVAQPKAEHQSLAPHAAVFSWVFLCAKMSTVDRVAPQSGRAAQKQQARNRIERELVSGSKSVAQIKRENESFALPPSVARVNLGSALRLV